MNNGLIKIVVLLVVAISFLGACSKETNERVYTAKEIKIISDSFVKAKEKELLIQSQKDLEYRKAIELRYRIDSIKRVGEEDKNH
ncbi:MAG TPA: hypothetical protein PKX92_02075 [Edaphocola sp.]|nr:hypothetical protein [Edaphocola sp.]